MLDSRATLAGLMLDSWTLAGKEQAACDYLCDITGSLCENNDKFAIDRSMPNVEVGDCSSTKHFKARTTQWCKVLKEFVEADKNSVPRIS